jgi:hypothetical protein
MIRFPRLREGDDLDRLSPAELKGFVVQQWEQHTVRYTEMVTNRVKDFRK